MVHSLNCAQLVRFSGPIPRGCKPFSGETIHALEFRRIIYVIDELLSITMDNGSCIGLGIDITSS